MRWIFSLIFCVLLASTVSALSIPAQKYPITILLKSIEKHCFVNLQIGQVFSESGRQQTLYFSPINYNLYLPARNAGGAFDYSLGIGSYEDLSSHLRFALGIAFAQTQNQRVEGTVYQYALFPNLKYQYDIRNDRFLLTTRWSYEINNDWSGFADLDVGLARLTAHNYSESPLIEQSVPNPPFESSEIDDFTYQAGLGASYQTPDIPHWRWNMGVGYLSLPKHSQFGPAAQQTSHDRLELGDTSGTRIWFGATYLFGRQ